MTEPFHESAGQLAPGSAGARLSAGIAASPYRPLSSGHVRKIADAAFDVLAKGGQSPAQVAVEFLDREGLGPKESEQQL